jgi:hypothetical protein
MYMQHQSLVFDLHILYLTFAGMPREFFSGPFSPKRATISAASRAHTASLCRLMRLIGGTL